MFSRAIFGFAFGALPAHLVGDQERMNRAVIVTLVQFERAVDQRLDDRQVTDQVRIILGIANRRRPGNRCPVEQGNIIRPGNTHCGTGTAAQSFGEARMLHLKPAQSVVACPQIELARAGTDFSRRREILFLHFVGILLDKGKGVLRETAGGGEQQSFVLGTFRQQTLHQLQTEGHRRPDQLRVVVRGKR